jgi:hypothetical protein
VVTVVRLAGEGAVDLSAYPPINAAAGGSWKLLLSTEDRLFAPDPVSPLVDLSLSTIHFGRPGAVLLRSAGGDLE